jgi:hypothetical protein
MRHRAHEVRVDFVRVPRLARGVAMAKVMTRDGYVRFVPLQSVRPGSFEAWQALLQHLCIPCACRVGGSKP